MRLRRQAGAVNKQPKRLTLSVPQIFLKNTLTLFNLINIALALAIVTVGHPNQILFLGIAISNTVMGIVQELRAKRILDKLAVLSQSSVTVVRDGRKAQIKPEEIVLDDIVLLTSGNQVCADSVAVEVSGLEIDESLLTGESRRILKSPGSQVMSGSYVVGGRAYVRVTAVGTDNFATGLTTEALKSRKKNSRLLRFLQMIIRVLTVIIIPLGLLLFFTKFRGGISMEESVLGASAAVIGMIPEGLVLLSGITLTLGALNLARRNALVQSLPCIETLARADVLCLDKTGTITDGTVVFDRIEPQGGFSQPDIRKALSELNGCLQDTNTTAKALEAAMGSSRDWRAAAVSPFTSDRKWSGASFEGVGSYLLGAPRVLLGDQTPPAAESYAMQGKRVLCLAFSHEMMDGGKLPERMQCAALLILTDNLRKDAAETFRYFESQGVTIKVISGDDANTAGAVALAAGISGADNTVDMSRYGDDADYRELAGRYTVFGRVSPHQKRDLIRGLQAAGHTACMTGDGVNDILAMREARCSVAMIGGSDAARSACDFVLMTSDFKSMIGVLMEGRRVINNIEKVSSLYLSKTVFSLILTLIYILLPFSYPFAPLQMTPVNALTIGIPSFLLALRASFSKPGNYFLRNVLQQAVPAGLTVVVCVIYIGLVDMVYALSRPESSTMSVFLIAAVGFFLLLRVSAPLDRLSKIVLAVLGTALVVLFTAAGELFTLESIWGRNLLFCLPMLLCSYYLIGGLSRVFGRLSDIAAARRNSKIRE